MGNKEQKSRRISALPELILVAVLSFGAGFIISRITAPEKERPPRQQEKQLWTCSMHPQIQETEPGKCRICGMDLIPVESNGSGPELGPREISFSPEAVKLMEIETSVVEQKYVEAEIRMSGKVGYNETKLKYVTAWVPGRIDKLFVDFTGTEVIKGDHMVRLYSPELISAQAEYLQALKAVENLSEKASELIKDSSYSTLKAAKEKLLLLGLTERQLDDIRKKGEPTDYLTIYAPVGGVVLEKHVNEGGYLKTGSNIYTIADLSEVWVTLDAYESDVDMVTYQQEVEFSTEAYPGEVFKGRITFIPPTLNDKTRTVKMRVNVPNPEGKLKPGMFVRAVVHSRLGEEGVISDANLAGKYVCPMHPSIIKDEPGTCDICKMDLVTTESRGLEGKSKTDKAPLVIPVSAPLITGKRAVVYVRTPDTKKPTFEGREIVLGQKAGDYYLVKKGLREGDIVVTKGNFKIDSALQIQAKKSMMSQDDTGETVHDKESGKMEHQHSIGKDGDTEQKICPVMGGEINKKYFTVYKGKKVYFCCPGCIEKFLAKPEKYLDKLPQFK